MKEPRGPAEEALVVSASGAKAVGNRHHWLFSGAVVSIPPVEDGRIVPVRDTGGQLLGHAYFNRRCSLVARMVSFGSENPTDALRRRLRLAGEARRRLMSGRTDAWRVVNGEGDGVPGLILDRYADMGVLQIGTLGMERLREELTPVLADIAGVRRVYERSESSSRREEGLPPSRGWIIGEPAGEVEFHERGLRFVLRPEASQKTGFFLDQREMRALVEDLAPGRRVLDCFCYTGAFSAAALRGGAREATLVDSSAPALETARTNLELNGFRNGRLLQADVLSVLPELAPVSDLLILDPPAFAKRRRDVVAACRRYARLNGLAVASAPPGALILTFSCSQHVDAGLFQQVVFQAAVEAGRDVRILARHRQAPDHPVNLFHPETEYLKGLLLQVS